MSIREWLGRSIGLKDGGFWSEFFGAPTYTDRPVTGTGAMSVAAYWACNRLLSQCGGILPAVLYQREADGSRKLVREHPTYDLIHTSPNAEMTAPEFWESVIACQNIDGNAYGFKQKVGGRTVGMDLIHPDTVKVDRRNGSGALRYQFTFRGDNHDVGTDDIVHFRGWGIGGDKGLSVIANARQSLAIAMAGDEVAGKMFANGNFASGFIQTNGGKILQPDQRDQFKTTLREFTSSRQAGNYMLLEGGFEFKPLTINPDDMEMLRTRGFSVEEICRWFLVPPFMIGHTEKNTSWGAGLEQQLIAFLTFALMPYLNRISKRIDKQLLTAEERAKGLYSEFLVEALLRADSAARAAFYSIMVNNGLYTRNEVRAKENLPKAPGGDLLTVQSALVPLESLPSLAAANGNSANNVRNALRAWLVEEAEKTHDGGSPSAVH